MLIFATEGEGKMIKALVIAPYEGLFEMMKEIQQEVDDFELHIELGNLYEGANIAKDAEKRGYHIIISRGGTASMIQEESSIPVIDIQVSGYDVLRILTLVKGFSGKAAIVGFPNISQGAVTICKLLDLDIKSLTITKDTEVEEKLANLKKLGYEVVIGDVVTVQAAKQLGLTGVLITSGKEAIMDSLEEARRAIQLYSRLQQDVSIYQSILDCSEQAIGIIREEKIIYGNERFNKEFNWIKLYNSPGVKRMVQQTELTREKKTITLHFDHTLWKLTACPYEDTVIIYFEKDFKADVADKKVNGNPHALEFNQTVSYTPIAGKSEPIQKILQQIDKYSGMDEPVWIMGEVGNGKELIAQSIHLKRKSNDEPFITLNSDLLSEELLKNLISEGFFQKYANSVIYLKNIERLTPITQKELYHFLKKEDAKKSKWVVSSEDTIEEKVKNGTFIRDFYNSLAQLKIYIPPLRERSEDIEKLVHVFISELHPKYGNEVVGIRQDALEELANYNWPGNVEQLKHVIEQLVTQSQSYYIEKKEVETVLNQLEHQQKNNNTSITTIDISGTLEEIEKQVITRVLEAEEMNQSRAAKRLGINRSTLWRKLK
ncbi:PrpR N-terminal domain-containing protein [Neobacillus ginsengisoli]|uniref:Transcriptional regulator with PAS, ATPase and Fis domain n=1 Tax=Neobacillus ginsengisoli TaxID=904295 RepID=A0ABT9XV34_9BACI|nr:PrpR N-terminal domain-containing protein [Neobacillus ginsengisoli]MDQ0199361.1 transcriptional regulator with PAS, ATPase and Fis domain [Neobacillus ginsengisoli]